MIRLLTSRLPGAPLRLLLVLCLLAAALAPAARAAATAAADTAETGWQSVEQRAVPAAAGTVMRGHEAAVRATAATAVDNAVSRRCAGRVCVTAAALEAPALPVPHWRVEKAPPEAGTAPDAGPNRVSTPPPRAW